MTLDHDGVERQFRVISPEHDAGVVLPAVIALHGAGGSGERFEKSTGLGVEARATGSFIAVFPNGSYQAEDKYTWNAGSCCGTASQTNADDVGFLDAVMASLPDLYDVDAKRIYVVGLSNGGMMSYRVACELGNRVAGIAVVAGALNVSSCPTADPIPLVVIHGTSDTVVPYNGGQPVDTSGFGFDPWVNGSVAEAVSFWLALDGCDTNGVVTTEGTVSDASYADCAADSFVDVYTISGGEHTWPDDPEVLDATAVIEDTFLR